MKAVEALSRSRAAAEKRRLDFEQEQLALKKREDEFQKALVGKLADDFILKVYQQIEKAGNDGLVDCESLCDYHDQNGDTLVSCVAERLRGQGFETEKRVTHIPEYHQQDHFGEGDYSHRAYDSWTLVVSWGSKNKAEVA